ncbi:GNAT family N-acetyltransferase [Candidatus Parcubacteria bacterium]|nr:GNAT family N-acetyltransferase [Candidatus Parcubacteria bacterium]
MQMIKVIPLEKKYLIKASKLADSIFPNEEIPPSKAFEISLDKEKFDNFIKSKNDVKTLEYFVAIDENDSVIGTSGLYSLNSDYKDTYWLGWYCVHQDYRGKGIGKILLDCSIKKARKRGKKFLSLYTSTNPNETAAQKVYEKNGFYITGQKKVKQGNYEIFFRRKEL